MHLSLRRDLAMLELLLVVFSKDSLSQVALHLNYLNHYVSGVLSFSALSELVYPSRSLLLRNSWIV